MCPASPLCWQTELLETDLLLSTPSPLVAPCVISWLNNEESVVRGRCPTLVPVVPPPPPPYHQIVCYAKLLSKEVQCVVRGLIRLVFFADVLASIKVS